jgi:uncharacterized membrane protein YeaQ/YmgE (transglycosylase-associated protein family)
MQAGFNENEVSMTYILLWILAGALVGSFAQRIVPGDGPGGILGDTVIGIDGALLSGWLFRTVADPSGTNWIGSTIVAFFGAIIALSVIGLLSRRLGLRY